MLGAGGTWVEASFSRTVWRYWGCRQATH